jgi:hypothetical protein
LRFEFSVGDLVTFKTKQKNLGGSMHKWRQQDLMTKEVTAIIISKRYYNYDLGEYYNYDQGGEWFYTIQGSDGKTYYDCKSDQLKLRANWIKP